MFYSRLLALCKEHGINITNLISELGFSAGNLSRWKKGGEPRGNTLSKLADYFHVSTDYLLGRTDDPSPLGEEKAPTPVSEGELNETVQRFMPLVDKLTPEQQQLLLAQLQAWTGQNGWASPAAPNPDGGTTHGSDP